ncbi:MAG: hypothetical protein ABMA64_42650, partial [Myxococcota bacterium]
VHDESWVGAWTGADSAPAGPSDEEGGGDDSSPEGDGPPTDDVPVDPPAGEDDPPEGPSGPTDGDGGGPTAVPGCTGPQGGTFDDLLGDWSPYGDDDRVVDDPFDDDQGYLSGEEEGETPEPSDILPDGEVQLPPEEEPQPEPPLDPSRAFVQFLPVLVAGEVAILIEEVLFVVGAVLLAAGALETDTPKKWPQPCTGCKPNGIRCSDPGCAGGFPGDGDCAYCDVPPAGEEECIEAWQCWRHPKVGW